MSFKIFLLFLISACGVKGPPIEPKSSKQPTVLENYPDLHLKPVEDENSTF